MSGQWTTILIGNGLGMALDPNYFKIERGLSHAWNKLTTLQQERIKKLVTDQSNLTSEDQLDKHYQAIQACLMLSKIEQHSNLAWLDPDAREFPNIFREFVTNVARHFFNYPSENNTKLNTFLNNLKKFILNHNTHLATLNYDKLIYDRFATDTDIMNLNHAKLIDGFHVKSTGFDPSHLSESKNRNNMGFYLHLHGSPLFYTDYDTGIINKSKFESYEYDISNHQLFQEHLILCTTTLKPTQISHSSLLRSYWDFFNIALRNSADALPIKKNPKNNAIIFFI